LYLNYQKIDQMQAIRYLGLAKQYIDGSM
jgi:hypothetical protein